MDQLSIFQQNNLFIGNQLAAELASSSLERLRFVVIGAYLQNSRGAVKPRKALNVTQPDLRFWMRKYEVSRFDIENDLDITDHDLIDSLYINNIQTIEELESKLGEYISDFSLLEVSWKVRNPI